MMDMNILLLWIFRVEEAAQAFIFTSCRDALTNLLNRLI